MNRTVSAQGGKERHNLSVQEKQEFILSALPAMAQHTFGFICSVIGLPSPQMGRHCGTALRCMLNGRRAILTALHVIDQARSEVSGFAISTGYGELPYIVHGDVNIDRAADIAVFFLPDDYPDKPFWPSSSIDHSLERLGTDYLFLHGFPGKNSYSSQLLGGVMSKSLPYGAMRQLENLPPNLQPFEFAVEYDPVGMVSAAGASQDLIDPHGLSGSPVWRIGVSGRSSREWKPNDSLLVGILTQWRPDERVLVATSTARFPPTWLDTLHE
jgi:hypothetical protein